jgi:hypothetical protein
VTNIVTAEEVYDLAGLSVEHELVSKAQLVISTEAGLALGDAATFALLPLRDRRALTMAVVWQVVYLDQHPERFGGEHPGNVASASANGASITFRDNDDGTVAPLARRELETLSWRQPTVIVRTLRPYSRAAVNDAGVWSDTTTRTPALSPTPVGPQPDPWRTL